MDEVTFIFSIIFPITVIAHFITYCIIIYKEGKENKEGQNINKNKKEINKNENYNQKGEE